MVESGLLLPMKMQTDIVIVVNVILVIAIGGVNMFTWILCTYGIAFALCFKLPFSKERLPEFFQKLLTCMFCTGFWSGIIASALCFHSDFSMLTGLNLVYILLVYGLSGASVSYIIDTIIQRIERNA
jgi:hypothetical protein